MYLALFDIDGTLLTSRGSGLFAIKVALRKYFRQDLELEGIAFSGRTDPAILTDIFRLNGMKEQRIEGLLEEALEAYAAELERHLKPEHMLVLPGVHSLLEQLSDRPDVHLGLVTGNVRETAHTKLRAAGLDGYFRFGAYGCDHVDRNLLPAVASGRAGVLLGRFVPPERTVVIGDTPHDIACSRHFGARCVAVATGRIPKEELARHTPDLLLETLEDVSGIMDLLPQVQISMD